MNGVLVRVIETCNFTPHPSIQLLASLIPLLIMAWRKPSEAEERAGGQDIRRPRPSVRLFRNGITVQWGLDGWIGWMGGRKAIFGR